MVLHFKYRSRIHFELSFVKGVRSVSSSVLESLFPARGHPVVPAPFVEETIFAPCTAFAQPSVDYVGLFLGSLLCSIDLFVYFFHQRHTDFILVTLG